MSVERSGNHLQLLLPRQFVEVDSVARDAYREVGVLLRVVHRVAQRVSAQDAQVDVLPAFFEVPVQQRGDVGDARPVVLAQHVGHHAERVGYSI